MYWCWLRNQLAVKFSQVIRLPFVVKLEQALYLCENENIVYEDIVYENIVYEDIVYEDIVHEKTVQTRNKIWDSRYPTLNFQARFSIRGG